MNIIDLYIYAQYYSLRISISVDFIIYGVILWQKIKNIRFP